MSRDVRVIGYFNWKGYKCRIVWNCQTDRYHGMYGEGNDLVDLGSDETVKEAEQNMKAYLDYIIKEKRNDKNKKHRLDQ